MGYHVLFLIHYVPSPTVHQLAIGASISCCQPKLEFSKESLTQEAKQ
jgi:hypothetical protein